MNPKKYTFIGIFLVALVIDQMTPANILVITFFSRKSHKLTYMHLIEELGKRGHNITVVSPVKPFKEMKNVKEIYTMDINPILDRSKFDVFDMKEKVGNLYPSLLKMTHEVCNLSLDLPQVRALLSEKFDLVFYQSLFNDCVLGIIYRLQVPFIIFTPTAGHTSFFANRIGGHYPLSNTPNFMTGFPNEMTFYQRFINFGVHALMEAYLTFINEATVEKILREKLGEDIPPIQDMLKNASMILCNGHFSLTGPRPNFPDVVEVGGIHSGPANPIPQDLEDFIQKGKDGFILFSMGTAIKGDMMPEAKRKIILQVFSKLKQQVLWKWESETMPDLPNNVKLSKWLPQQDLLGHKDIKMFITHCGGGSTEEAIYHGVPLVGVPMLADQPKNAETAKNHGILVDVNWNEMKQEDFMGAIQEILTNPIYRDNVKRLSSQFRDRPQDPLDLGVYWVEYVLRHKGAPHLRNVGRKLNTLQYHSIDVIGTYLGLIGLVLYLIFVTLRFICKKLFCHSGKKGVAHIQLSKKSD